jgi:16S rRNA pseudouridine516 synthase
MSAASKPIAWHEVLYTQGFGTRRVCWGLIEQGRVEVRAGDAWRILDDPAEVVEPVEGLPFRVHHETWHYHAHAYIVLHKPAGVECSHKPGRWPSVYSLLPTPLRVRPTAGAVQGVQAVGRLDQDTTGLLLLSDDGAFIHRMASPKHHVPKVYQVRTASALMPAVIDALLQGVRLHDEPRPVRAAAASLTGPHTLDLTLTEGKYHQVKRMLAAVGHEVVQLHRARMGGFVLPADLAPGQWRWLSPSERALVSLKTP